MEKIIIAALAGNNVISDSGKIQWYSKEELNHFKKTTIGFPVLMGRKTFESIGQPLNDRINLILSRNPNYKINCNDCIKFSSIDNAIGFCAKESYRKIFIIGGGEIFRQTIDLADKLIISDMNLSLSGDVHFPVINENVWEIIEEEKHKSFKVITYIKK